MMPWCPYVMLLLFKCRWLPVEEGVKWPIFKLAPEAFFCYNEYASLYVQNSFMTSRDLVSISLA